MELWHHIPGMSQLKFMSAVVNDLLGRIPDLSDDQALQIVYYVSQRHLRLPEIHQTILQDQFSERIDKMSLEVTSIWSLAFFKNDKPITNKKLLEEIYSKLLQNNLTKLHEIGLSALLKVLESTATGR